MVKLEKAEKMTEQQKIIGFINELIVKDSGTDVVMVVGDQVYTITANGGMEVSAI